MDLVALTWSILEKSGTHDACVAVVSKVVLASVAGVCCCWKQPRPFDIHQARRTIQFDGKQSGPSGPTWAWGRRFVIRCRCWTRV